MHTIKEVSSYPDSHLRGPLDVSGYVADNSINQYEGHFKGLGVRSKPPTCMKRASDLKKLHNLNHFAVGAKHWDSTDKTSTSHEHYQDHGVAFQRHDIPDKMASVVDLKQSGYNPNAHFRTEQREKYEGQYRPRLPQCDPPACKVHLGDDKPDISCSYSNLVHVRQDNRVLRSFATGQPSRAAGVGTLLRTTSLPAIPRVNPIHGGPRNPHPYDLHTDLKAVQTMAFSRKTANHSSIVYHPNVRDPILGIHIPKDQIQVSDLKTTDQIIAENNSSVPPLKTLSSVRPASRECTRYPEAY